MKKLISSILVLAMVLSLISGTAIFANAAEGAVAKIGDTEYTKLEDAIKAAPKNDSTTIYLLQDYKISSTMAGHQYVQNLTIDLGGHTLTSTGIALTAYRAGTTLTVQNGTVVGNSSSGSLRATYGGKLILGENLTVKGAGGGATLVYVDNGSVEIAANNGVNFVGGKVDFKQSTNANNKVSVAASIGRTYFGTLADAVAVGGEVTLLDHIQLSETIKVKGNVTLNLNGKAITGTDNATGNFALIEVQPGATLTVNGEGKIGLTATNNRNFNAYSSVISNQRGTLIINGGTIQHSGGTDMAYAIDNLTNGKGTRAETVINGGRVSSTYRAVRQFLNGVEAQNILTINGGTIEGANKSVWMQDPNKNANTGKLTVSEGATLEGDVYLFVTAGSTEWPVEVSIAASAVNGEVLTGNVPAGYKLVEKDGVLGVVEVKPVVIGDRGFDTLADAIAAAQNGDEIVLNENISVDADDLVDLDGYYTFFKVAGKSITIDLNGKTVYADASAVTDKFVVGVFSTANGGHLTLTGGTVKGYSGADQTAAYLDPAKGNKDYNYKFYSLLANYNNDCSITVEDGNYVLDYAGDSLAYTSCNEGIVVNGGTFKLGNLGGIRNGMPWIFNARGQNQRHVVVNGGSFNADVLHQYWIFEVEAPKELALKNENGMYTVVPAVAYVNEQHWSGNWYTQNIGYATLEEAKAAVSSEPKVKVSGGKTYTAEAEEVVLLQDVVIDAAESNGYGKTGIVIDGQILNGNGYSLTVNNAGGTWDSAIYIKAGTVKNLTVKNAFRGIFTSDAAKGDIYIDNVTFDGVVYTFNSDGTKDTREGNVYVSNSVVNGWTSFSDTHKDVVFTDCKFGEGSGYAFCRPYNAASFVGCEFADGFQMDTLGAVTFENCTIAGEALTADNLATLVTGNIQNASVK